MKLNNAAAVRAAVAAGDFCDVGHYHCPHVRASDGSVVFPSGILHPDDTFEGSHALAAMLAGMPADYQPTPVASADRYPTCSWGEAQHRCCAATK